MEKNKKNRKMSLTGERNTDLVILLNISNEKDFLSLCQTNKKAAEYCNDENLLMSRLNKYYPNTLKWKGRLTPWKEYYLQVMYYIGKLEDLGFIYSKDSTGLPSEYYYYYLMNQGKYFAKIVKKQYLDLALFVIRQMNLKKFAPYRWETFRYCPTSFIEKYLDEILGENPSRDSVDWAFLEAARGGKWDNYQFLLQKYPEHNTEYKNLRLGVAGGGGNRDIINFIIDKFGKNVNNKDPIYLTVALGAYDSDRKDVGDEYLNKIENLEKLSILNIDMYDNYLSIGIKSDNQKLLDKIIEELFAEVNDEGEILYYGDFVLSFNNLCRQKTLHQCKKLLELGIPKKVKNEILEDLKRFYEELHSLDGKSYDDLKFFIETR